MKIAKEKLVPSVLTGLIIVLFFSSMVLLKTNVSKGKDLKSEKLNSEKLLSERLTVEKELTRLKNDYSNLKNSNEKNEKLVEGARIRIEEYENRLKSLAREANSFQNAKKELADLRKLRTDLENENLILKKNSEKLDAQSRDLQQKVNQLTAENDDLRMKIEMDNIARADNLQLTASRSSKKERLTIKAARTKKINLAFEVPYNLADQVGFRIITPSGEIINPDNKEISWNVTEDPGTLTASLSPATGQFEETRRLNLTYTPKEKLQKGVYRIEIMNSGNSIGSYSFKFK